MEPNQTGASARAREDWDSRRRGGAEEGSGKAGDAPGDHILEVEVPLDELAKILGESSSSPTSAQGAEQIVSEKDKYFGGGDGGARELRHFSARTRRRSSGRSPRAPTTR